MRAVLCWSDIQFAEGFGRVLEYIIKGLWTSLSCTERAWPVCGVLSLWGQFMTYDQLTNFSQRLNCQSFCDFPVYCDVMRLCYSFRWMILLFLKSYYLFEIYMIAMFLLYFQALLNCVTRMSHNLYYCCYVGCYNVKCQASNFDIYV